VTVESTTYPVQVYVPSSYGSEPVPAVLNWHGLGSTGPQQAFLTDYESLAEQEGFLVAHPTGMTTQISGDAKGWELDQFDVPGRDDVAMAAALIDRLIAEYCADPQRVYSTGMSNGGFFTSRLVCELSDRIAAAVSVAGVSHHDDCSPTRAVPFMAFHGTDDTVVPFAGGVSTLLGNDPPPELTAFFDQVMPDEFAEFSTDFGCSSEPVVTNVTAEVVSYDYQGCDNGVAMSFVEVVGGGHTWPGSPLGPVMEAFVGLTTDDVSATVDGWTFMSRFTLPE
jgi:polyhydroxybutyrate depolymerase